MNTHEATGVESALSAQSREQDELIAQNALNAPPNSKFLDAVRRSREGRRGTAQKARLRLSPRLAMKAQEGEAGPEEETIPPALIASAETIEELLAPYADLIARAERGELLRGETMHLSTWERTKDLNFVVLAACRTFRGNYNAPGRVVRTAARAQTELLERCRLAQENGGNAIRPADQRSGAVLRV